MQVIVSAEQAALFMNDIEAIDFTMIKLKLQDKEEGQGWSEPQCQTAEQEYKRFLALKRTYPEKDIVWAGLPINLWHFYPSLPLFWHEW